MKKLGFLKLAKKNSPKCLKLENDKSWANFALSLTNLGLNQTTQHFRHIIFYLFCDFSPRILCNKPMSNFISDIGCGIYWNIGLSKLISFDTKIETIIFLLHQTLPSNYILAFLLSCQSNLRIAHCTVLYQYQRIRSCTTRATYCA